MNKKELQNLVDLYNSNQLKDHPELQLKWQGAISNGYIIVKPARKNVDIYTAVPGIDYVASLQEGK